MRLFRHRDKVWVNNHRYIFLPHQSRRECSRRLRQIWEGRLKMAGTEDVLKRMVEDLWQNGPEE